MTKEEIYKYLWEQVDAYDLSWEPDCEKLAEQLYRDGWSQQVKAEWIEKKYQDGAGCVVRIAFTCSNCQETNGIKYDYCPSCGAKMWSGRR